MSLLNRTLSHIKNLPSGDKLDQTTWYGEHECGTTACFAGWALILSDPNKLQESMDTYNVFATAKDALDITELEAQQLFFSCDDLDELEEAVGEINERKAS